MKKITALVLMSAVMVSLCACDSSTAETEGSTAETTAEVTETELTEATEESTAEETTEAQAEDVIIPLFDYVYTNDIKQMPPESVASDFYNTIAPYMPLSTVTEVADANMTVYHFTIDGVPHASFTLGDRGTASTELEVYLCVSNDGVSTTSFSTSTGGSDSIDFIPLFYNETKGCLVGYSMYNLNNPGFREVYWDSVINIAIPVDADPGEYGL